MALRHSSPCRHTGSCPGSPGQLARWPRPWLWLQEVCSGHHTQLLAQHLPTWGFWTACRPRNALAGNHMETPIGFSALWAQR